jgi:hypothetical protein
MKESTLLPRSEPVALIDQATENDHTNIRVVATRDHELVRRWAQRRQAEPATGEATESGPRTIDVNDDGTGLRFNFPGLQRFRPIEWDEWFRGFDAFSLVFVYERDSDERGAPSATYRLLPFERLTHMGEVVT